MDHWIYKKLDHFHKNIGLLETSKQVRILQARSRHYSEKCADCPLIVSFWRFPVTGG